MNSGFTRRVPPEEIPPYGSDWNDGLRWWIGIGAGFIVIGITMVYVAIGLLLLGWVASR